MYKKETEKDKKKSKRVYCPLRQGTGVGQHAKRNKNEKKRKSRVLIVRPKDSLWSNVQCKKKERKKTKQRCRKKRNFGSFLFLMIPSAQPVQWGHDQKKKDKEENKAKQTG